MYVYVQGSRTGKRFILKLFVRSDKYKNHFERAYPDGGGGSGPKGPEGFKKGTTLVMDQWMHFFSKMSLARIQ